MAATGPKPPKPQDKSTASPTAPSAADLIASEDFQQKLDRARERRAKALGPEGAAAAKPVPDSPVLVLRPTPPAAPEPDSTPAAPAPVAPPPPLSAPRRAASPAARDRTRLRTGLPIVIASLTMAAAMGCVAIVVLTGQPVAPTTAELQPPRVARSFALDPTAPAAPARVDADTAPALSAPPDGSVAIAPRPDRPRAPARSTAPVLGPPPAPPLASFSGTPVRILGAPDSDAVADLSRQLRAAGLSQITDRPVDLVPATTSVRFFRAGDRALAEALAGRLGADLQDLTSYRPAPSMPGVDIWLAGP